jgi:hypothetical protein
LKRESPPAFEDGVAMCEIEHTPRVRIIVS